MRNHANIAASVLARLKNLAKKHALVYNDVLQRYAVERILKRLEQSPFASKCILKGGSLFIIWSEGFSYRPTMDIDLEFRGTGTVENLLRLFRCLATIPGEEEDGLRIDAETLASAPIRESDAYGGIRMTMKAYIGNVRLPLQFDVGIGDAVTPPPRKARFPALLDGEPPIVKVYPKETVVSEKFETIVRRGFANSRMKDYYDLFVLHSEGGMDSAILRRAIERTFARRRTPLPVLVPEGLSDSFATDSVKLAQWRAFLRKNHLNLKEKSFLDVVSGLKSFFVEILGGWRHEMDDKL